MRGIETCILSIVKQITSPGWMHETSAQAWCTGKTQRNWVEREVEGGSGWGMRVTPWLIHVNVWQSSLQYCKVISLQLIKINEKKKKQQKDERQVNCIPTPYKNVLLMKFLQEVGSNLKSCKAHVILQGDYANLDLSLPSYAECADVRVSSSLVSMLP